MKILNYTSTFIVWDFFSKFSHHMMTQGPFIFSHSTEWWITKKCIITVWQFLYYDKICHLLIFITFQPIISKIKNPQKEFSIFYFQAYVVYYALSSFFIPFIVILFCYSKMCVVLWGNFKQKKAQEKADLITISPERQGDNTTHHENTEEVKAGWKKIALASLNGPIPISIFLCTQCTYILKLKKRPKK